MREDSGEVSKDSEESDGEESVVWPVGSRSDCHYWLRYHVDEEK